MDHLQGPPTNDPPVITVRDVNSWRLLLLFCALSATYLAVARTLEWSFADFDIIAIGVLLTTPIVAWIGPREIILRQDSLIVLRRGRVRLHCSLDDLLRVISLPFVDIHWAMFSRGRRVILYSGTHDWAFVVNRCKERVARRR